MMLVNIRESHPWDAWYFHVPGQRRMKPWSSAYEATWCRCVSFRVPIHTRLRACHMQQQI